MSDSELSRPEVRRDLEMGGMPLGEVQKDLRRDGVQTLGPGQRGVVTGLAADIHFRGHAFRGHAVFKATEIIERLGEKVPAFVPVRARDVAPVGAAHPFQILIGDIEPGGSFS